MRGRREGEFLVLWTQGRFGAIETVAGERFRAVTAARLGDRPGFPAVCNHRVAGLRRSERTKDEWIYP